MDEDGRAAAVVVNESPVRAVEIVDRGGNLRSRSRLNPRAVRFTARSLARPSR